MSEEAMCPKCREIAARVCEDWIAAHRQPAKAQDGRLAAQKPWLTAELLLDKIRALPATPGERTVAAQIEPRAEEDKMVSATFASAAATSGEKEKS